MKTKKTIITAPNVSPVSKFQAFMADKNAHSWCGNGGKPPITTAKTSVKSMIIDKTPCSNATTDEANDVSHVKWREARPPPRIK